MGLFTGRKTEMVDREGSLPGRAEPIVRPGRHLVLGTPMAGPYPEGSERAVFGMGCFWGAERLFWGLDGVFTTAVGYSGGYTPNPTYEEVCSGRTGHAEVVFVVFDPSVVSYERLVRAFFEGHDPTQLMRQGNDVGTQYRSALYTSGPEQQRIAEEVRRRYQAELAGRGFPEIATEIEPAGPFYFAEDYHQQYLAANPSGYCGLGGTGVSCPAPAGPAA